MPLGLQRHELAGEARAEVLKGLRGRSGPDDDLAEPRVGERGDHVPGAARAVRDQRRRVRVGPPAPDGGGERVRDAAECDWQAWTEGILVYFAPRPGGRGSG